MAQTLAHYRAKLRDRGFIDLLVSRLRWYKLRFQLDNWMIGRLVELFGNRVTIDGILLDIDNPLISTPQKSTLYFGIYEIGERELTKRFIDRRLPTVEIGGSIGCVACLTNRMLSDPHAHVVVECNPILVPTLALNRRLNGCHFMIDESAIAYDGDTARFFISDHFLFGSLAATGTERISIGATTLAAILKQHQFGLINLIIDAEGAEVEIVENEHDVLRYCVKCLILETHEELRGTAVIQRTLSTLASIGFETVSRDDDKQTVLALRNRHLD